MTNYHSTRGSRRTSLQAILFLAVISCGVASSQEHNNSRDSFNDLNILFRREYAEARNASLEGISPVIIVRGDFLVMIRGEERTTGSSVHANYHDLKAVSHGPLALYCILSGCVNKPLTANHTAKLAGLRQSLTDVAGDVEVAFEDGRQRSRQVILVQRCVGFIDSVLKSGQCSSAELNALVDGLRPMIVLNAAEAAGLRIENYHAQMKRWRKAMSDEDWKKLYVVIPGAAMPRKNNLAVRYFAKLFQQDGEGNRVIYAESQFDEAQDLRLLGTHMLDSSIGKAFFDDSSRMKRDLLGPFANAYLDSLDFEGLHDARAEPAAGK